MEECKDPTLQTSETNSAQESISIFLARLFDVFERNSIGYAVARNYESLPDNLDGRDLDILVDAPDIRRAYGIAAEIAESLSAKVLKIEAENGLWVFIVHCDTPFWGVRIDMLSPRGIEWRGCYFLYHSEIIESKVRHRGIYFLENDDIVFMQFCRDVSSRLCLREKYHAPVRRLYSDDPCKFEARLSKIFGRDCANKIAKVCREGKFENLTSLGRRMRREIIIRSLLKRPASTIKGMFRYLRWRCREYFRPNGIMVAVIGPDGSGKGTLIREVSDYLSKFLHLNIFPCHLRPDLLPSLGDPLGRHARTGEPVANPHAKKPRGMLISVIHLAYYTVDYILGYWLRIRPRLGRKYIAAIFDRYFYDYFVDNFRFRISLPGPVIKFFGLFIPKPDVVILLSAEPEIIRRRKPELPVSEIRRQACQMHKLAEKIDNVVWIDTSESVERSTLQFIRAIVQKLEGRMR